MAAGASQEAPAAMGGSVSARGQAATAATEPTAATVVEVPVEQAVLRSRSSRSEPR